MKKLTLQLKKKLIEEYVEMAKEKGFFEVYCDGSGEALLEESAKGRISDLEMKMLENNIDGEPTLKWEFASGGIAKLDYRGEKTKHVIPPNIFLVGTVGTARFYKKFVSHPFYQWGLSTKKKQRG